MKTNMLYVILILGFSFSCKKEKKRQNPGIKITFEKINYYKYPVAPNDLPFQYRLTYYFDNGMPHRWMELDSIGRVMTDYIYKYDSNSIQTGARYREDSAIDFSIEKVRFQNDSTMITEWVDSLGQVYYTMIDNLNKDKKTYRAEFIGDRTHGYDSTFYTKEGFVERVFFTNTKGKVFNDRTFNYDSINDNSDWIVRKKIMQDSIREVHMREVYYDKHYTSQDGKFYDGIISTGELSENVINFSADESIAFLTRTSSWTEQSAFIAHSKNGIFTETIPIEELDRIYNGAISPNADKIIYSIRENEHENIWLIRRENGKWANKTNLTRASGIEGGYFYWLNDQEIYFYQSDNKGDIRLMELSEGKLSIKDSLISLNTPNGTEFSPYVEKKKQFMIFTRYEEGNALNQGFFVSYNLGDFDNPQWSKPEKLAMLPYGWSAYILNDGNQFIYTDGEDIRSMPLEHLKLDIKK
ncbi:MAG: hypothetical protein KJN85_01720 [Maribacter sp.]|nr:hypothetical protein [Maribacter sp.]